MTFPTDPTRRLEALERAYISLRQLVAATARPATAALPRGVYLAKTIRVGGSYPAAGSNTFGLQFIDREFTASEGTQAKTDHARSAASQAIGRTLDNNFLAEGTVCLAIPCPPAKGTSGKGRWQILPLTSSPALIFLGTADGDLEQNTTGDVTRLVGGTEADAGITDSVINKWPTIADGDWVIYGLIDDVFYVLAPSGASSGGGGSFSGIPFINNNVAEDIVPHGVMFVPDSAVVGSVTYLLAETPGTEFDIVWLINGATAVAPTDTGLGTWNFETSGPVAIQEGSDPLNEIGWGPMPYSQVLHPYKMGFTALNSVSDTVGGQRVSEFRQREVVEVFGKLKADLDVSNFPGLNVAADFEIIERGSDHRLRVSGWDPIPVYPMFFQKGDKRLKGTKGRARWYSNHWEGDFACDPDNTDMAAPVQAGAGGQDFQFFFHGSDTSDSTQ